MDFRLDEGQLALQDTIAGFCAARFGLDDLAGREGRPLDRERWRAMAELGIFGVMVPEAVGGAGLGATEAVIVFEQLGRYLVDGPALWTTLGAALVDGVVDGSVVVGGTEAGAVPGDPVVVEHAADIDVLLVLRGDGVFACPRELLPEPRALQPLDPLTPVAAYDALPQGERLGDGATAARLRLLGTLLSAALLVGVSSASLDVARDHSLVREQFGVPIGSFQALKHLMADMFVRTGLARSATYAAAAMFDDPSVGDPVRAGDAAKLLAGDAALGNARGAVQVLGGMGFTWDMPPNFLLKRAWVLEHGFGTAEDHALGLASHLEAELS
jgi:alkylation response protein AidB-like acyl-CoA dehydrogenase